MIVINILVAGLVVGALFGFLLQKGSVANFNTIVGQFLFKDFTMLKVMLSAIIVGGVAIYALAALELIPAVPCKSSSIIGSAVGGVLFGIGMATLGYCPGTALAAVGQGARDALFGISGMFFGVLVFERAYILLKTYVLVDTPTGNTVAQILHISPWLIFTVLFGMTCVLVVILKRYRL